MLVDDDPDITTVLLSKLEKAVGYNIIIANLGKRALSLSHKEKPDLVVCDIDIPDLQGGGEPALLEK